MSLLAPIGLTLLLTVPVIVLIHLLRGRHRPFPVPALFLWADLPPGSSGQAPRRRLPLSLLLALQVLAASAAALALARPATPATPPRHLAIVLDASASMQATDAPGFPSRFEDARARARTALDSLAPEDTATLVRAGPSVAVLAGGTAAGVRPALDGVRPGIGAADLREALLVASSTLDGSPGARREILLLTDGASPVEDDPGPLAGPVRTDVVGQGAANRGVVNLQVRPDPARRGFAAFAEVASFATANTRVPLQVLADGALLQEQTVDLPPGGRRQVAFSLPAGTQRLTVRVTGQDALPLDDVAEIQLPRVHPPRVLLVSERGDDGALRQALGAVPDADVRVVPPAGYGALTGADQSWDLVAFESWLPDRLPDLPALVVAPPPGNALIPTPGTTGGVRAGRTEAAHPLLAGVDVLALQSTRAVPLAPPAWLRPVLQADGGPLVLAGAQGAWPRVVLALDSDASGLEKQLAFPLLVANAVSYLVGAEPALATGSPLALPGADDGDLLLVGPDGRHTPLPHGAATLLPADLPSVGRYQVLDAADDRVLRAFDASVLDPAESDLQARSAAMPPTLAAGGAPAAGNAVAQEWDERWRPVVLALVLVLSLEWLAFARRG